VELPMIDLGETVVPEAPAPAPDSGPFVTETMAELYLQQGHKDEALRVYTALLEQRPGDPALQAKIAGLQPRPAIPAPPAPSVEVARKSDAAPTIREVLTILAMRRPGVRPEPPRQNGGPAVEQPSTVLAAPASAPAPADAPASPPAAERAIRADTISALFGNAAITPADESAARSLALAFAEANGGGSRGATDVPGSPARRASDELSLDSVFGSDDAASPAAPSTFSFDQFFSPRASTQGDSTARASGAHTATPDDVAHFPKWLEGLKQR